MLRYIFPVSPSPHSALYSISTGRSAELTMLGWRKTSQLSENLSTFIPCFSQNSTLRNNNYFNKILSGGGNRARWINWKRENVTFVVERASLRDLNHDLKLFYCFLFCSFPRTSFRARMYNSKFQEVGDESCERIINFQPRLEDGKKKVPYPINYDAKRVGYLKMEEKIES